MLYIIQALLQKADVLFAAGDFEYAMVQYHRGMMVRPDQSQFRLGVQKSKNAIEESNGFTFFLSRLLILNNFRAS